MTNIEKIKFLRSSKNEFIKIAKKMMEANNGRFFPLDLFLWGTVSRSLMLVSGFCDLVEKKNFLSAAPIIRLYLDTLLQIHAAYIYSNPHEFSRKKMDGKQTNNLRDKKGNKMTDNYLARSLGDSDKKFKWVHSVYKETSGFVHFSEKHIFSSLKLKSDKSMEFTGILSDKMDIPEESEKEMIDVMIEITKGLFDHLISWTEIKDNNYKTKV